MEAPRKRYHPSVVWEYFHLETQNKVRCMSCDRQLAYCNNTSPMLHHLRSTYPALWGGGGGVQRMAPVPRPAIDTAVPSKQGMHCMKPNSDHKVLRRC